MRRDDPPTDYERAVLTEREILQLKDVAQYAPDLVDIAKRTRTISAGSHALSALYRAVKSFCISFIFLSGLAIAFKQSVLDAVHFLKGAFK